MTFRRIKDEQDETDDVQMIDVYAIEVPPKAASAALQILNAKHPLPTTLEHAKRIWRCIQRGNGVEEDHLLIIIAALDEYLTMDDWHEMLERDLLELCLSNLNLLRHNVPARMPRERREYEEWRRRKYWPTIFHEHKALVEMQEQESAMIQGIGNKVIKEMQRDGKVSAILVDPRDAERWLRIDDDPNSLLDEPAMIAINRMAVMQSAQPDPKSYLCTGHLIFCREEPSIMSAMALVHSRVKSVIFINACPQRGGLQSRLCLQHIRAINHHFSVYQYHAKEQE